MGGDGDACGQGACVKKWGEEGRRRDEGERAWREQVGAGFVCAGCVSWQWFGARLMCAD